MAGHGQIPNPALRQYDALRVAPAIYLMETDCSVKVGRARSALSRMRELHGAMKRRGMQPGRWQVFYTDEPERAELRCIHALQHVAAPLAGTREYFTGISFDAALGVVRAAMPIADSSLSVGTAHRPIKPGSPPFGLCQKAQPEGATGANERAARQCGEVA